MHDDVESSDQILTADKNVCCEYLKIFLQWYKGDFSEDRTVNVTVFMTSQCIYNNIIFTQNCTILLPALSISRSKTVFRYYDVVMNTSISVLMFKQYCI